MWDGGVSGATSDLGMARELNLPFVWIEKAAIRTAL